MEKEIRDMIALIQGKRYDEEMTHYDYDMLLERFIKNYDEALLPLMNELIGLEKDFWYA